jgi:hypothetical protein
VTFSIIVCLGTLFIVIWILRRDRLSLGLPVAYLISLLLIHVPGAYADIVSGGLFADSEVTESGIGFAAIGAVCFIVGVWSACHTTPNVQSNPRVGNSISPPTRPSKFWLFCLLGGWLFIYGLSPLHNIPSLGAAVDEAGAIWMLGVLLGLRSAVRGGSVSRICFWVGTLMVYPVAMLLLGGFLSYGSAAIIIVGSALTISIRRYWRVAVGIPCVAYLGLTVFVNYFESRDTIRDQVWGGAPLEDRTDTVVDIASNFHWFDWTNLEDLFSLHERLNQNFFVGLAARRIRDGQVESLDGRSLWEAVEALVPRVFWPDKPVSAGSPMIVSEMTGLRLSPTTSFGIGNVMEFQINFGLRGVIGGFLILGWLIGTLDRMAAASERRGELGRTILYFLPTVALIQPIGSVVELASGAAAAIVAAYGWRWAWDKSVRQARPQSARAGMI